MGLYCYQKKAVDETMKLLDKRQKIQIEMLVNLGRFYVMAGLITRCVKERNWKVLAILPEDSKCEQIKKSFGELKSNIEYAAEWENYSGQPLLLTTLEEFAAQAKEFTFDLIVTDGCYILGEAAAEKLIRFYNNKRKKVRVVGITSQIYEDKKGFFEKAESVKVDLREAIKEKKITNEQVFEAILFKIFQERGYKISRSISPKDKMYFNLYADKINGEEHLAISIKTVDGKTISYKQLKDQMKNLAAPCLNEGSDIKAVRTPVLVTNSIVPKERREKIENDPVGKNVVLLDVQNLIYMIQDKAEIDELLRGFLPYSTEEIVPERPNLRGVGEVFAADLEKRIEVLIKEINSWNLKVKDSRDYENLCGRVLYTLFADELSLWRNQKRSNGNLYRFDLICKIKDKGCTREGQKEFWRVSEEYFQTRYIIFEFKNHTKKITQDEIVTTEKYLYPLAFRRIAIIISVKGANWGACREIRGALRSEGKLIISLSNQDLIAMLEKKKRGEDAASCLSDKLDELFISLEK